MQCSRGGDRLDIGGRPACHVALAWTIGRQATSKPMGAAAGAVSSCTTRAAIALFASRCAHADHDRRYYSIPAIDRKSGAVFFWKTGKHPGESAGDWVTVITVSMFILSHYVNFLISHSNCAVLCHGTVCWLNSCKKMIDYRFWLVRVGEWKANCTVWYQRRGIENELRIASPWRWILG